ncbi:segregation and condensation protein A [Glycomyces paridis]|uniref:Segregation and condensation protein A n=1 Tax=Glycomyces paridis TaxID=2126555 RepID=A0A4S8PM35_9ACTN|nr:ScpA family protein [Glycomyces paridis]THV29599.1 segregation/condensation protein A [Glycomyces paridis]
MTDQQPPQLPTQRDGEPEEAESGFHVRLDNFEGPFDLLLQLIGKHKLDVTEVALHQVASEFITYVTNLDEAWNLEETSEFLLVAATLLDLKTARLLPGTVVDDEEDLALLEARDLLFARLLQYKAYKEAAGALAGLAESASTRVARNVGLEARFQGLLPELVLDLTPEALAVLAAKAMRPRPAQVVGIDHVHMQRVSVREHAVIITRRLQRVQTATFRALTSDCETHLEVVARFLALLELYREALVGFEQMQALGELTVRWLGGTGTTDIDVDEYAGAPAEAGEEPNE